MMNILHLTLHKKWFEEIASGKKKEEFRKVKPYWTKRIEKHLYDEIHFRNGYRKDAPFMRVEYKGWKFQNQEGEMVYALQLGEILEISNYLFPVA